MRSATPEEEEEAYGLFKDEFKELQMELGRKGSKRGFEDISGWEFPPRMAPEDEEKEQLMERPAQRARLDAGSCTQETRSEGRSGQEGGQSSEGSVRQEVSSQSSNAGDDAPQPPAGSSWANGTFYARRDHGKSRSVSHEECKTVRQSITGFQSNSKQAGKSQV